MPKFKTVAEMDEAFKKLSIKEQAFVIGMLQLFSAFGPKSGIPKEAGMHLIQDFIVDPTLTFKLDEF